MKSFLRSCWWSTCLTTVLILGVTILLWKGPRSQMPAAPTQISPLSGTYVAEYDKYGTMEHYIYYLGLFGMHERLQKSDVILLGSSHVAFGLSAAELSHKLSNFCRRPVSVYNISVGFGDGPTFARAVLASNDIENKSVVLDLFTGQPLLGNSGVAQEALRSNVLGGYLHVLDVWLKIYSDYFLDPVLPRIHLPGPEDFKMTRMLGLIEIRSWETGDVMELWAPTSGYKFAIPNSIPMVTQPYDWLENRGLVLEQLTQETFSRLHLAPVYTVVPFDAYLQGTIPANATPYIPISDEGLFYFDKGMHLTTSSRAMATDRLFDNMKAAHVIDEWLSHPK